MKVSIITVCFNSELTVEDTINSVMRQDYSYIEHIIVDGGSVDSTLNIIESISSHNFILISESDLGIYDAMNKGIDLASGDVIGILNSDDFYLTDCVISDIVECFQMNPDKYIVLGNLDFVQPNDVTRPVRFYSSFDFKPWKMHFGFMPAHPAAFIRCSAYNIVGPYKLGFRIAGDFEWFVRAFLVNKLSFVYLNKPLVRMREGGVSTSGLHGNWLATKEMNFALKSNKFFSTYLFVLLRLPFKFFDKLYFRIFRL